MQTQRLTLQISCTLPRAFCPLCQRSSERIHGRYGRTVADAPISRIVSMLTPGAAVTTTRAHVYCVVTEYGRTTLLGLSDAERAHSLIFLAAPQFREQLERAAHELHLLA